MNEKNATPHTALMSRAQEAQVVENVIVGSDLSKLTPMERLMFYCATCESVGLNPLTRPLEYIYLENKLVLYARREATEQLRRIHDVSITKLTPTTIQLDNEDLYMITADAKNGKGRQDSSTGAVSLSGADGQR